jgi:signal transduction histidine kinase
MSRKSHGKSQDPKGKKVRASIVYKLNTRLFLRLIGIFLSINLFLCVALGIDVMVKSEKTLLQAVAVVDEEGLPDYKADLWLKTAGYSVTKLDREPSGFHLPENIKEFFPAITQSGARNYRFDVEHDLPLLQKMEKLVFEYEFLSKNQTYKISMELGAAVLSAKYLLLAVLILQALILLRSIFSGAGLIRKTLHPIVVLAEAAKSLNTDGLEFDIEKMEHLADKLDSINAAKLDTRISVEETEDELQSLASAINSMLDRINESYRSQIRFVSDASHELRTPISVIEGYANLLDRWGKNDEKTLQEGINAIKDEASNMKGLVEQLLFLARGDNNSMHLQMESFDLSDLANDVLRETKMIDSGHDFNSHSQNVLIYADKGLIKQALRILMDNAIKYSNAGGKITISVIPKDDVALLTVKDEGIGISPDAVPYIFDRFYRADQSRTKKTGGTGLGLSIAKWIAERHAGHMEVLSREGFGTKISIAIPVNSKNQEISV